MSLDFVYLKTHIPVMGDIQQVILAVGWALLLGNLVFQALRSMVSGLGFEGEDPKLLFARTFVFGFLLLASPQICEIILGITSRVIAAVELPDAINVQLVDGSVIGVISAAWLLVIIFDLITMFMVFSLLLEVAERYVVLAMLTIMAPLAFAMGGSKSTSEIFTGWCRMFGSMCFLMAANIVFFKMLLSVVSTVPSFPDVFLWMVLIVSIVKVAKKADEIITRIGLNPAITGNRSTLPGVIAYTVFRTALSMVTKGAANGVGGALGLTGKAAAGAGKGAAGLFFKGASGAAGAAGAAAGVATGGIGAVAGAAAGGIGGAAAQAAGQRSERPRYGGGRTQQANIQQEHTQQNTSQTQAGSQQQTTAREAEGRTAGPQGISRPASPTRRSSVQQGTKRAPSYVTPPGGQSKTEESSASHSSSFSGTARGGGFSGSSRGGGFTKDNARGGSFSSSATHKETAENTSRSGGLGGSLAPPSRGGGFPKDTARGGGFSSSTTQKETATQESTSHSTGISGTRGGGFSGPPRGGGFSQDTARGGGFGGASTTGSSSTVRTSSSESVTTTNISQSGTTGMGTRSSRRTTGPEPRHSRNAPPSTPAPTSRAQRSGPVQQEQRRADVKDRSTGKGGAPVHRPGTAGTGTGHRVPPGQKPGGGSPASKPARQTNRKGGPTSV